MKLTVNGEEMDLAEGTELLSLLKQLSLRPELVVVEHNLEILKRGDLPGRKLCAGDQVEIVHFVGGGSSIV